MTVRAPAPRRREKPVQRRVDIARARAHDQPFERGEPHRGVHRASVADRGHAAAVSQMQRDQIGLLLAQQLGGTLPETEVLRCGHSEEELADAARRIITLERAYNAREGMRPKAVRDLEEKTGLDPARDIDHIAVDDRGRVFVSDNGNDCVSEKTCH